MAKPLQFAAILNDGSILWDRPVDGQVSAENVPTEEGDAVFKMRVSPAFGLQECRLVDVHEDMVHGNIAEASAIIEAVKDELASKAATRPTFARNVQHRERLATQAEGCGRVIRPTALSRYEIN